MQDLQKGNGAEGAKEALKLEPGALRQQLSSL